MHIWRWFELPIATTLIAGWNLIVFICIVVIIVANVVELRIIVSGEVSWTLVVFLTVVLIGISRRGQSNVKDAGNAL